MKDNNFGNTVRDWLSILAFLLMLLLMGSCKSSKVVSDRETKDSVVYTYKTLYRDSLRVKDSTVLVYETVQRDSVVLRVDFQTGNVVGKDTWHWRDTSKDRDHVAEVRNMVEKSDSAASADVKSDNRIITPQKEAKLSEAKKTHYWKIYWLGMLSGVLLTFGWKYRKVIIGLMKKIL